MRLRRPGVVPLDRATVPKRLTPSVLLLCAALVPALFLCSQTGIAWGKLPPPTQQAPLDGDPDENWVYQPSGPEKHVGHGAESVGTTRLPQDERRGPGPPEFGSSRFAEGRGLRLRVFMAILRCVVR